MAEVLVLYRTFVCLESLGVPGVPWSPWSPLGRQVITTALWDPPRNPLTCLRPSHPVIVTLSPLCTSVVPDAKTLVRNLASTITIVLPFIIDLDPNRKRKERLVLARRIKNSGFEIIPAYTTYVGSDRRCIIDTT